MGLRLLKKGISLCVCSLLIFCSFEGFAREVAKETEVPKVTNITAECSFKAKLDDSFKGSWVYDLMEEGSGYLYMKIQKVDAENVTVGGFLATIGNEQYFYTSSFTEFAEVGVYDFVDTYGHFDGKIMRSYSSDDDHDNYLRIILTEGKNGLVEGSLWMHHGYADRFGIHPVTSEIPLNNVNVSGYRKSIIAPAKKSDDSAQGDVKEDENKQNEDQENNDKTDEDKEQPSKWNPAEKTEKVVTGMRILGFMRFFAKLDSSFENSWLYDLSDNGTLEIKLQVISENQSGSDVLITLGDRKYFCLPNCSYTKGTGIYDFTNTYGEFKEGIMTCYPEPADGNVYLRVALQRSYIGTSVHRKAEKSIWLHNGDGEETSSIIYSERLGGSMDYIGDKLYNVLPKRSETKYTDDTPIDYGNLSDDPRRWDDKEKSIEAYGRYRDDDGVFHNVLKLRGKYAGGGSVDYNIDATATFQAYLPKAGVSTDGNVKVTYYNFQMTLKDEVSDDDVRDRQFLKLEGDLGEKLFISDGMDVRRADSSVEYDPGNHLEDDSSIYLGFTPVESFDGYQADYIPDNAGTLSLTFMYSSEAKITLEAVRISYGGRRETVPMEDIQYIGRFVTLFLQIVYPTDYVKIAKEMGLSM